MGKKKLNILEMETISEIEIFRNSNLNLHHIEKREAKHQKVGRASLDGGIIFDFGGRGILRIWEASFVYFPNSLVASLEMENSHKEDFSITPAIQFVPILFTSTPTEIPAPSHTTHTHQQVEREKVNRESIQWVGEGETTGEQSSRDRAEQGRFPSSQGPSIAACHTAQTAH